MRWCIIVMKQSTFVQLCEMFVLLELFSVTVLLGGRIKLKSRGNFEEHLFPCKEFLSHSFIADGLKKIDVVATGFSGW